VTRESFPVALCATRRFWEQLQLSFRQPGKRFRWQAANESGKLPAVPRLLRFRRVKQLRFLNAKGDLAAQTKSRHAAQACGCCEVSLCAIGPWDPFRRPQTLLVCTGPVDHPKCYGMTRRIYQSLGSLNVSSPDATELDARSAHLHSTSLTGKLLAPTPSDPCICASVAKTYRRC